MAARVTPGDVTGAPPAPNAAERAARPASGHRAGQHCDGAVTGGGGGGMVLLLESVLYPLQWRLAFAIGKLHTYCM